MSHTRKQKHTNKTYEYIAKTTTTTTYQLLTPQRRKVTNDIVYANAYRKRHAAFDRYSIDLFGVQFRRGRFDDCRSELFLINILLFDWVSIGYWW